MAKQTIKTLFAFVWLFVRGKISFIYTERCKRAADMLEKFGVAGAALGVFQGVEEGLIIGIPCLLISLLITQERK